MLQSPLPPASAGLNALPHWKEFSKYCLSDRFKKKTKRKFVLILQMKLVFVVVVFNVVVAGFAFTL